jgi:hypothetical protein
LYFLAPKCLRRGYKLARESAEPKSPKNERVQGWLLEMLISELDAFACWYLASDLPLAPL